MPLKLASCEWLFPAKDSPEPDDDGADALPPCSAAQFQMEQVPLLGRAGLYLFKARFDEAAVLCTSEGGSGSNLGLVLTQVGHYQIDTEGCGPCLAGRDAVILHSPEERRVHFGFPAGQQIEAMALIFDRDTLGELLRHDRPPSVLRDWLEGRPGIEPFARRLVSSPAFASTARHLARNPYQGLARRLFMEAKVLEGVAELVQRLGDAEARSPALTPWERSRVFEARDLLTERVADPPTLAELARLVGLPVKRLDRLFREVFGTTPFGWVRDYRLTLAHRLLTEENLPIKQVAHRLGYANVHNFTHAFTARFGVSPGALRGRGKGRRG